MNLFIKIKLKRPVNNEKLEKHTQTPLLSMYVCIPACSQIWAKVIQGCRGPCLGALLCRDDATSDRACSTRLAAIDVAWTEPEWRESCHYTQSHLQVLCHTASCYPTGFYTSSKQQDSLNSFREQRKCELCSVWLQTHSFWFWHQSC